MDKIHYQVYGEGHPIILLHGFCETHRIWSQFVNNFPPGVKVYSPDLPGFGESHLPEYAFSVEDVANQMVKWMGRHKILAPLIIGHSLGGYVALAMQASNPDLFSGMILFHSTASKDNEEKRLNRLRVIEFVKANGVETYIKSFVPGLFHQKSHDAISGVIEIAKYTKEETFVSYTHAMRNRPSGELVLENTRIPILILAGEYDEGIPVESLQRQAQLSNKIELVILPDAGHMGLFESEKAAANRINGFILKVFG
jgi:pimeloyl-ACP methyl ester carboxylesterase